MRKCERSKEHWSSYLQPVMNNVCRTTFTSLPQDKREDYEELKRALLATYSTEYIKVGAAFWTYEREKGQSFPQMEKKLTRLAQRFCMKKTVEETVDAKCWRSCCSPSQHQQQRMSGELNQTLLPRQHKWLKSSSRTLGTVLITQSGQESQLTDGTRMGAMGRVNPRTSERRFQIYNQATTGRRKRTPNQTRTLTNPNFGTRRKVSNALVAMHGDMCVAIAHRRCCL